MNFEPSAEQVQLADSVTRLLADSGGFEQRRRVAAGETGWNEGLWRQLCELGLPAMAVGEDYEGFGGGMADLQPVFRAFGSALLLEPALPALVLAPQALQWGATETLRTELLPKMARGQLRLGWAHDEAGRGHERLWVETRARCESGRWHLTGVKHNVLHAAAMDRFLVSARSVGESGEARGLALFLVDAGAAGVRLDSHRLIDDTTAGDLHLDGAAALPIFDPSDGGRALRAIERTERAGIAAACADMVGAMEAAFDLTKSYVAVRKQFGRAIGENQALRHRIAEMYVSLEVARSMAVAAALAVDDPEAEDAEHDSARAKLVVGRQARALCQLAIQLHGGIGMTEECAVGHYLRRVLVLDQLFGDVDAQAARLAQAL
jgi:pimeloyl-CoA dehydrogenase